MNDEKLARERFEAFLRQSIRWINGLHRCCLFMVSSPMRRPCILRLKKRLRQRLNHYLRRRSPLGKLLNKYPTSEQASLALYNTAVIQAEKFGKLEDALATFKRMTWGNWEGLAKSRAALLSERSLTLATERLLPHQRKNHDEHRRAQTSQTAFQSVCAELQAYFRKQHKLEGIDLLDLDLIEPDKTWETPVNGYEKHKGIEQKIDKLSFPDGKPGVCVVRADGEDWQAATLGDSLGHRHHCPSGIQRVAGVC